MCLCTPAIKTPFCGKPGCQWPDATEADSEAETGMQSVQVAVASRAKYHPSIQSIVKFFAYSHLPPKLQDVSRRFSELAQFIADNAPDNPETTVSLRKLLESKDAAVRASL